MTKTAQQDHEMRDTMSFDVDVPGHDPRKATPLFERTRKALIAAGGTCWVCGCRDGERGPLEAHHHPIERSLAGLVDFGPGSLLRQQFPAFDWVAFDKAGGDPYNFVDDMAANGLLLCKAHHTGKDEGIHDLPFPVWVAQRYALEGKRFNDVEIIHHEQEAKP